MSLPATDVFTGSDGTALTTYSANWTLNFGDFQILGNQLRTNSPGNDGLAYWNADTFANNQYAQCTLSMLGPSYVGPAVRCAVGGADTGYYFFGGPERYLTKVVTGTFTQLGSTGGAASVGQVYRLEANGTTITPKIDGVTDTGVGGAQTDSAIASGAGGVSGSGSNSSVRMDDWEAGDLGGAAPTSFLMPRRQRLYRRSLAQ